MAYASLLSGDSTPVYEFKEGNEDPMFWACLGDDPWASADYWSEREALEGRVSTAAWKVNAGSNDAPVRPLFRVSH
jgi:hypothetical protein